MNGRFLSATNFLAGQILLGVLLVAGPAVRGLAQQATELMNPLQIEIVETSAPAVAAKLVSLSFEEVVVEKTTGHHAVKINQLRRLRFNAGEKPASRIAPTIGMQLVDGSHFSCEKLSYDGNELTFQTGGGNSIQCPASVIANCKLTELTDVQRPQWQAISQSRLSSDTLILVRSPEALDKIEGIIQSIDAKVVKFEFDGQTIDVPLARLAGFRFFVKQADERVKPRISAIVGQSNGDQWIAQSVSIEKAAAVSSAQINLVCGVRVTVPLNRIAEIDFSIGSLKYLAEMEPIDRQLGVGIGIDIPEFGNLFGPQPLTISMSDVQPGNEQLGRGPALQFLGPGSATYRVPDGYERILGSVELCPDGPQFVPCRARIYQEEKILFEKALLETRVPFDVDIPVQEGRRIKLVVETDSQKMIGIVVLWRQLRFAK